MKWLLRFKRTDGGWDVRTFRGSLDAARLEAKKTMARSDRYEAVWIVESEDRKL